jgi:hypothetical protein
MEIHSTFVIHQSVSSPLVVALPLLRPFEYGSDRKGSESVISQSALPRLHRSTDEGLYELI